MYPYQCWCATGLCLVINSVSFAYKRSSKCLLSSHLALFWHALDMFGRLSLIKEFLDNSKIQMEDRQDLPSSNQQQYDVSGSRKTSLVFRRWWKYKKNMLKDWVLFATQLIGLNSLGANRVKCFYKKYWSGSCYFRDHSTWVPANQPVIHEPLKFTLNSKDIVNDTLIRYNVTLSGKVLLLTTNKFNCTMTIIFKCPVLSLKKLDTWIWCKDYFFY